MVIYEKIELNTFILINKIHSVDYSTQWKEIQDSTQVSNKSPKIILVILLHTIINLSLSVYLYSEYIL